MEQEPLSVRLPISQLTINPTYRDLTPPLRGSELDDLRKSIVETGGFLYPIIVEYNKPQKTYFIIDGHHRYQMAQELGISEVPCLQIFTEDQRQEALLSNVNRRQLPDHERRRIKDEALKLFSQARETLIPPLRMLHKKGELTRYIGSINVQRLMVSSLTDQETFYNTIRSAFDIPDTSGTQDPVILDELKKTSAALAVTETINAQLEQKLKETKAAVCQLTEKITELDQAQTITDDHDADRERLSIQISGLQQQIASLTEDKSKATKTIQTLKHQVTAAETEMKAAQMAARSAEKQLQASSIHTGNPDLIATSLESLLKLMKTIQAMIEHAQPLEADCIREFQHSTVKAAEILAAIEAALLPAKADIVPGSRKRQK